MWPLRAPRGPSVPAGGVYMTRFAAGLSIAIALGFGLACTTTDGGGPTDAASGGAPSSGGSGPVGVGGTTGGAAATGGQIGVDTGGTSPGSGGGPSTGGSTPGSGGAAVTDTVTLSSDSYTFNHFVITAASDGMWNGSAMASDVVTASTLATLVLENGFLKVTLLPEYGGRILSIVHKPTNRELLYQNPVGTPYLMNEDIFYYDYLVILGGIFPSFPEPEHGKYWNQPYAFEVVSETPEAITVRMSRQDDLETPAGVPTQYDVGRTDLLVELEVTLRAGRSNLELATKLSNPTEAAIPAFEYWTVTTLAPGSVPGQTEIPEATRILAQMDQVHCLESSWPWFGQAETRVDGEIFEWNNLSHFENWDDQGTCFANPEYTANWSGLVNYENDHGVLRVTSGGGTRGLKLWTFGIQSLDVDMIDSSQWLRPTIEMWHGVTPEFWQRGSLAAGEARAWQDDYFPTLGLREVTAASENGALHLSRTENGADSVLGVAATLTLPGQTVHAILKLDGAVVHEADVVVDPAAATTVEATVPTSSVAAGAVLEAEFLQGTTSLLSGQVAL